MFVKGMRGGYKRNGERWAAGYFLILQGWATYTLVEETGKHIMVDMPLRACVRYVRMHQCGHFMMGGAMFGRRRLGVSGTYGCDGLPTSVGEEYATMVDVPRELDQQMRKGGGHNSAGSEGPSMREWARANFDVLRKAGR